MTFMTRDGHLLSIATGHPGHEAGFYVHDGLRMCNSRPLTRSQVNTLGLIAYMIDSTEIGRAIDSARLCDGMPQGALQFVEHGRQKSAPAP
jgi:hypothetical protein